MTSATGSDARVPEKGFTLIELIMVLIVIAVCAALVFPSFRGSGEGLRLRHSARRIVVLTKRARLKAVTEAVEYRLSMDPASGEFWLTRVADPLGEPGVFTEPEGDWGRRFRLEEGVQFGSVETPEQSTESGSDEIGLAFYPDGTAEEAKIVLAGASEEELTIKVRALTGMARLLESGEAEDE
jgi:type II secretion system protein H